MNINELTDRIYDTLFQNTNNPQFPMDEVEDQFVSAKNGAIMIKIDGKKYMVKIQEKI